MADVEFGQLRDGGHRDDIVEGEAVAGVRLNAVLDRKRRAIGDTLKLGRPLLTLDTSITTGVELDDRRAKTDGGGDLLLSRLDEQADADVRGAELVDVIGQVIVLPRGVEPTF